MNSDELKSRHKQLMNAELGNDLLKNPDLIWQTSDFLSKLGKRCRRCYSKVMNDILRNVDTNKSSYYESVLCNKCLTLYNSKLNKLNKED